MKPRTRYASTFTLLLCLFIITGGVGFATADEPESEQVTFEIDTVHPNDIRIGDDLEVEVRITNTGDDGGEQDIELIDPPSSVQDSTSLQLSAGDSETVTLNWGEVTTEEEFEIVLSTDDDTEFESIEAPEVDFAITATDVDESEPTPGSLLEFTTLIRNEGTAGGEQEVTLTRLNEDGSIIEEVDSQTVSIDATESREATFDVFVPSTPGEYSYAVNTVSDTDVNENVIRVLQPAEFTVDITDTSVDGSTINVVANVENIGEVSESQRVQFSVDDSVIEEQDVMLDGGSSTTVEFSETVSSDRFRKPVTVSSNNDSDSTIISKASIEDGPSIDTVLPGTVRGGEDVDIMYTADGISVDTVMLQVTAPNGERVVDTPVSQGTGEVQTVEMPSRVDLVRGEYEVTLRVEDTDGRVVSTTDDDGIIADTVRNPDAIQFGDELYTGTTGDFVTVDAAVEETSEMYVLVGGGEAQRGSGVQNYVDVLKIDGDGSDLGDVEFAINTRLIGTDRPSEAVYFPVGDGSDFTVTSYAHSIGADQSPEGEFTDLRFTDGSGNTEYDSLADIRRELGVSSRGKPLQEDSYRVIASSSGEVYIRDDGISDFEQPIDKTFIELTQPELGLVTSYTLPSGSANKLSMFDDDESPVTMEDMDELVADATETSNVTVGDRLIIEVEATGMYGALLDEMGSTQPVVNPGVSDDSVEGWHPDQIHTLNELPEGVSVSLEGTTPPGLNEGPDDNELVWDDVGMSQVYVVPKTHGGWMSVNSDPSTPAITGFYVIVDTRDSESFKNSVEEGDTFDFELAYESPEESEYMTPGYSISNGEKQNAFNPSIDPVNGVEHYPYFDESETTQSINHSISFNEQDIVYDNVTRDGDVILPAEENQSVTGTTSLPKGSEISLQLTSSFDSQSPVTGIRTVEVKEGGDFTLPVDFTSLNPRDSLQVELYNEKASGEDRILDKRKGIVVADYENPSSFNVTDVADDPVVEQGDRLTDVWATIENTGDVDDRKFTKFKINGETVKNESVPLEVDEDVTIDLSDMIVTISPGTYSFEVVTPDGSETGSVMVTEPESGEIENDEDSIVEEVDDAVDEEEETEDGESGLFGLIGLRGRDVLVTGVITSAVYVLGALAS